MDVAHTGLGEEVFGEFGVPPPCENEYGLGREVQGRETVAEAVEGTGVLGDRSYRVVARDAHVPFVPQKQEITSKRLHAALAPPRLLEQNEE